MTKCEEFAAKRRRVERWLAEQGLDGVVLCRSDNFAWLGCGADNVVNAAQETGVGALVVQPDGVSLVTNNIETERLLTEELDGLNIAGTEVFPWHEPSQRGEILARLARGHVFAADDGTEGLGELPAGFAALRYSLTAAEVERYRALGRDAAAVMEAAAVAVEPGMTEADVAALVAMGARQAGIVPVVLLVAADERILNWRHPVAKETPAERCVMMVICGRRRGLVAAVTRLVHFGELSDDLRARQTSVCAVDAAMMAATQPGRQAADVLAEAQAAYAANGFPDEWQLHHQGGAIGYLPREYIATAECRQTVQADQAFAWNPSIRGTKSEDTILVGEGGFEVLTAASPDWPAVEVEAGGRTVARPGILVR
jgi:antitoxin VapB